MELQDLVETPIKVDRPLDVGHFRPFMSQRAIEREREYDTIYTAHELGTDLVGILRKTKSSAMLGTPGHREDGTPGLNLLVDLEFKDKLDVSPIHVTPHDQILQVKLVRTAPASQSRGFGMLLYFILAQAGYVVVSDNTQYQGGAALWQKIASMAGNSGYAVYVIDDGTIRKDESGQPIIYDGSNIEESGLWSSDVTHRNTLFALRRT